MKKLLLLALSTGCLQYLSAQVRLPKIFGHHMVLQRDRPIPVWGWASPNEKITVAFNGQKKTSKADKRGRWQLKLDPVAAGGPYIMTIGGKDTMVFRDVLVGEVWLCSGQSNMEWPVAASNITKEQIHEASYLGIRHFKVLHDTGESPKDDLARQSGWLPGHAPNIEEFTAVGYFFAKELHEELHVPIGLINSSWGGTDIEAWTSQEAFRNSDEFKEMIAAIKIINLDSAARVVKNKQLKQLEVLQGGLPNPYHAAEFSKADFGDTRWPKMQLPALWETRSLGDLDGTVWFRYTIDLPMGVESQNAVLKLAMIDDIDDTYVNGILIGSTNGYNIKRVYTLPAGSLKSGRNIIAVRVQDTGGGGGIFGDSTDLSLDLAGTTYSLAGFWKFQVESLLEEASVNPNSYPTLLYNAMIHPLIPYAIRGAIWYQGENNAGRAYQYRKAFPLMISDWRKQWKQGDFPFYFVQLASFEAGHGNSNKGSTWAELREAQTQTLSLPNTGMAVTIDIGETKDIHPRNKLDVGKRLAAIALAKDYGKQIVYSGPVFKSMHTDGNKLMLEFANTGDGLLARDPYGYLKGFEIAGSDKRFVYAKAFIEGNRIIVYQEGVETPVAVRYAWADDAPEANLFNKEGFPAVPFRTDDWEMVTRAGKYAR